MCDKGTDCKQKKNERPTSPMLSDYRPSTSFYFPGFLLVVISFLPVNNFINSFFPTTEVTVEENAPLLEEAEEEFFWKQGSFRDSRDGKIYRTVQFDNMVWMAENLRYDSPNSICYDDDPANCRKYGRLYSHGDAKNACPEGWHLPNERAEWSKLRSLLNGHKPAYRTLVAGGISKFDAVFGGAYVAGEGFKNKNEIGAYWSGSYFGNSGSSVWSYRFMRKSAILDHEVVEMNEALSCRCVKNYPEYAEESRYND